MSDTENVRVQITSLDAWRDWLERQHGQADSIWLVSYKKHVEDKYVAQSDIIDEALCFGWIDSLPGKLDADRTMLRLSPRKPGSAWSRVNKDKVARLIMDGRMRAPGLAKVEAAQRDGSWTFLDDVDALIIPEDLVKALAAHLNAAANFDAFPKSSRRGILEWIKQAKKPETRERRISETARLAAMGVRANHPEAKKPR